MNLLADIKEAIHRPGKSKGGLAKAMGVGASAVTALFAGDRLIKAHEVDKIKKYLDLDTVPIVGYVGAGGAAHYYAVEPDEFDRVPAPDGSTAKTVAVEIRGESMGRLFDRWYAFYDDVRSPITDDLIGQLCVVGLTDGRVLIKRVKRGDKKGVFTLVSNTGPAIGKAKIEWAAKVKTIAPR